ncbi:MAG: hypothetical protein KA603_11325 [Azonexus sp.]|nr:hypothetical protein [Betaproteobacteria bacterium]MBK8919047.1 hypothetical protein [Betaproteobacteria bacterium]MBP6036716.1 hypothetical protein [Azonexus sp.]MBP6905499.1 hypothetical protein [Azonexus sp.]
MSPPDNSPRDAELARLYRQSQTAEPPPALDATILAASRQALQPQRQAWWRRLQIPVSVAATVMLALMLSLSMERHPPEEAGVPATAAPPAGETPAAGGVPAAKDQATGPQPGPAGVPASAAKALPRQPARPEPRPITADHSDSSPAASPPAAHAPAGPPAAHSPAASPTAPSAATSAPVAAVPNSPAPAPAAPARDQALPAPAAARSTESTVGELREERKALAAPTPAAGAAPAPAPVAADRALPKREKAAPSPADWIEEIRTLRRQGATQEAERRLREFRTAFPDYPLPDDLR